MNRDQKTISEKLADIGAFLPEEKTGMRAAIMDAQAEISRQADKITALTYDVELRDREIERLQAEVERLSVLMDAWRNDYLDANASDLLLRQQLSTARNDALEETADLVDSLAEGSIREDMFRLSKIIRSRKTGDK